MTVLLLRLAGPMQSWMSAPQVGPGADREPSKCGVVALLCSAMGVTTSDTDLVLSLARLRMGVRVDREGVLSRGFPAGTALGLGISGAPELGEPLCGPGGRNGDPYCLADASFLVGLEDESDGLLGRCDAALMRPRMPLYLGQVGLVPGEPVRVERGLKEQSLEEALTRHEWQPRPRETAPAWGLRFVIETTDQTGELRIDQPVPAAPGQVSLGRRRVLVSWQHPGQVVDSRDDGADWSIASLRPVTGGEGTS